MNKVEKIIGLVLLVGILTVGLLNLPGKNLGTYIDAGQVSRFTDVNITNDLVVDGDFSAEDLTVSDATTLLGATTISGATTLSNAGIVKVTAATSTLQIGNTASGVAAGCLVLGDSGNATATPVYITATGATITASTTKPAICR